MSNIGATRLLGKRTGLRLPGAPSLTALVLNGGAVWGYGGAGIMLGGKKPAAERVASSPDSCGEAASDWLLLFQVT
jgi:hypothetical protein